MTATGTEVRSRTQSFSLDFNNIFKVSRLLRSKLELFCFLIGDFLELVQPQ